MKIFSFMVVFFGVATIGHSKDKEFKIVGYLPEYRMGTINPDWGKYLTDLIYFSAQPNADGTLDLSKFKPDAHKKLLALKKKHGFRLLFCLGGWGKSRHFGRVASNPKTRKRFITELKTFCLAKKFDGIDFDWEFPRNAKEHAAYCALLIETQKAFKPHKLQVSIAIGHTKKLSKAAYAAVDYVHLMSYDHGHRHATYDGSVADVKRQREYGAPAKKICLGVPFYARHVENRGNVKTFAELKKLRPKATADEVDGFYFNNAETIRKKTQFAMDNGLGGIMIWEIGQDAVGKDSLLKVIHDAVKKR